MVITIAADRWTSGPRPLAWSEHQWLLGNVLHLSNEQSETLALELNSQSVVSNKPVKPV